MWNRGELYEVNQLYDNIFYIQIIYTTMVTEHNYHGWVLSCLFYYYIIC